MNENLKGQIKYLGITGLAENWKSYISHSNEQEQSNEKFLVYVIEQSHDKKKENARQCRLAKAKIPDKYVIETFPFSCHPKVIQKKILAIYDGCHYIAEKKNIVWIGPTGVGKSGLAESFLLHAINNGYKGRFIDFIGLISELYKSIADNSSDKVLKHYASYDCLLIDELGYVETDPAQVGLFFRLMQMRHKKKTTLITTNLGFSEWNGFLKNEHLTSALIDRLTEQCHIINMKDCKSIRPKSELNVQEQEVLSCQK
jgi:DNA replication protein DnaC